MESEALNQTPTALFARVRERQELRARLRGSRCFLVYGEAGTGKSLLTKSLEPEFPEMIYCPRSQSIQEVCRAMAHLLARRNDHQIQQKIRPERLEQLSSVAIRGLLREVLERDRYLVVLDHFRFASQQFFNMLREWASHTAALLVLIARSDHMEEIGFAASLFHERSDRFMLDNFTHETAMRFAEWQAERQQLQAGNFGEFISRIVALTHGNPGAIAKLIRMAALPQYRSGSHIKVSPLYLDFRMLGDAAAATSSK